MVNSVLARENRIMINEVKKDIEEIKCDVKKMANHYSKRLPTWATTLFMILTAIVGGLLSKVVL